MIETVGLSRRQAQSEAWALDAHGGCYSGAGAINRVLRELPGWRRLAPLYDWRPTRWLEERVYGWVAAHRPFLVRFFSAVPECERPGVECDP